MKPLMVYVLKLIASQCGHILCVCNHMHVCTLLLVWSWVRMCTCAGKDPWTCELVIGEAMMSFPLAFKGATGLLV